MIRLYEKLFVGPSIQNKRYQVTWKLKHDKIQSGIFIITLASGADDLMDILPCTLLKQPYYKKKELFVLGIASGKKEANELVRQIVERMYQETGGFAIREFVNQQ